jgi:hypothetical protein
MTQKIMKKNIVLILITVGLMFYSCTHKSSKCKADHKRATKNGIGWMK